MKQPYTKPTCSIINMASQRAFLVIKGSYDVEDLIPSDEQTVGGDE